MITELFNQYYFTLLKEEFVIKKFLTFICVLTFVASIITMTAYAEVNTNENMNEYGQIIPLITIPVGLGDHEVAYTLDSEGVARDGPASFTTDDKNNIFVLDTLGKKILVYDKNI